MKTQNVQKNDFFFKFFHYRSMARSARSRELVTSGLFSLEFIDVGVIVVIDGHIMLATVVVKNSDLFDLDFGQNGVVTLDPARRGRMTAQERFSGEIILGGIDGKLAIAKRMLRIVHWFGQMIFLTCAM